MRTQFGSWIFAVGGNKEAARVEGVPAARTKTTLFMLVSGAAWLSACSSPSASTRCRRTSATATSSSSSSPPSSAATCSPAVTARPPAAPIGSLIMSMSTQGIPFAGWNTNWRFLFLGVILLLAVAGNNYVRRRAELASSPVVQGVPRE